MNRVAQQGDAADKAKPIGALQLIPGVGQTNGRVATSAILDA